MGVRVGTLRINLSIDLKAYTKGLGRAERSLNKTSKTLSRIGGAMTSGITVPLLAATAAVSKLGFEFDNSLAKIRGLVGLSRDEVEGFRSSILSLAGDTAKAPKELADAMFFITSAGLRGSVALDALTVSAKASAAGLGETLQVADAITSAMNAYGQETLSAAQATSILVAAVREGKASAETIGPVLGRVIPIASELGVSFDQVAASIASMTRLGLNAAESSTALRAVLNGLLKPTATAKEELRNMGLSAKDLREQLREKGLLSVLETLTETFDGNKESLAKVFENSEALTGVLSLMGKNADSTRKIFDSLAATTVNDLNKAFADAAGEPMFMFQQALAEAQVAAIALSDISVQVVVPAIRSVTSVIKSVTSSINGMDRDTKNLVLVSAILAGALGPLALGFAVLFNILGTSVGILRTVMIALSGIQFTISGPLILAIALFATAAVLVFNRWKEISEGIITISNFLVESVITGWELLGKGIARIVAAIGGFILGRWESIANDMTTIFNFIVDKVRDTFITRMVAQVRKAFGFVIDLLARFGIKLGEMIPKALNFALTEIKGFGNGLSQTFKDSAAAAIASMGGMSTRMLEQLQAMTPPIVAELNTQTDAIKEITTAAKELEQSSQSVWAMVGDTVAERTKAMRDDFKTLNKGIGATTDQMRSKMRSFRDETLGSMGAMTAALATGKISLRQFAKDGIRQLTAMIAKILIFRAVAGIFGGAFGSAFAGGVTSGFGGARAMGGDTTAGKTFLVGEKGPELRTERTNGRILSNDKLRGMFGGSSTKVEMPVSIGELNLAGAAAGPAEIRQLGRALEDFFMRPSGVSDRIARLVLTAAEKTKGRAT